MMQLLLHKRLFHNGLNIYGGMYPSQGNVRFLFRNEIIECSKLAPYIPVVMVSRTILFTTLFQNVIVSFTFHRIIRYFFILKWSDPFLMLKWSSFKIFWTLVHIPVSSLSQAMLELLALFASFVGKTHVWSFQIRFSHFFQYFYYITRKCFTLFSISLSFLFILWQSLPNGILLRVLIPPLYALSKIPGTYSTLPLELNSASFNHLFQIGQSEIFVVIFGDFLILMKTVVARVNWLTYFTAPEIFQSNPRIPCTAKKIRGIEFFHPVQMMYCKNWAWSSWVRWGKLFWISICTP